MVAHPRHVEPVNRVFSPSLEDVQFSNRMVEAYKEIDATGRGTAVLDGRMIDYAMYRMGMDLLAKAELIAKKAELRKASHKDAN
jgi:citrate lyase beta subunit